MHIQYCAPPKTITINHPTKPNTQFPRAATTTTEKPDGDDGRLDSGRRLLVPEVPLQPHDNQCAPCQRRHGGDLHHAPGPLQLEDAGHHLDDAAVRGTAAGDDGECLFGGCAVCFLIQHCTGLYVLMCEVGVLGVGHCFA